MNLAETRTHEPLVNKPKVKRPKKAMPKVTKKRNQLNRQYMKLRAEYLRCHPNCEYFAHFKEIRPATEIHHRKGRGSFMLDTSTWMAVCTKGHQEIHFNTAESYKRGWMLPRR